MINRILLRIKVIQILYSFYKGDEKSIPLAEKEFLHSLEKTYELYFHLLKLSVEITRYASSLAEARRNKYRPTAEELAPNMRFIDNRFVSQLSENKSLNEFISTKKLSWVNYPERIKSLYEKIVAEDFFIEYMNSEENDYQADKNIWRKIYKKIILLDEDLDEALEDQSLYWINDVETVMSFVIKTIKKFEEEKASEQELLPMFHNKEDLEFGKKLLETSILNEKEYVDMIDQHTRNWEIDRIAFMDILIMQTAIAELCTFPTIPVNVTLNEYIEISKNYSTDKSANFTNGVLDNIVNELKTKKKLTKVVMFSNK